MKTTKGVKGLVSLPLLLFPLVCDAKVTGQCGNCHTMHNSQGGAAVARVLNKDGWSMEVTSTPNEALLNTNCIGCHQGNNDGGITPYVLYPSGPIYGNTGTESETTTLAGGNFYWVCNGQEATGHNVSGITISDIRFGNTPPGGEALSGQLTCAGTNGCHGDRAISNETEAMLKSHHANDMTKWKDGSTLANSFRFLYSVQGFEDQQYEYRPTYNRHNKYYGIDRTLETQNDDSTISSLCAKCHGDFHQGSGKIASGTFGSGVWLRHPTDFDMGSATTSDEYANYNGGGADNYSVISPVGTTSKTEEVNRTVLATNGDAIVMCLSCHRAHGTPYQAILRWDYKAWPGPGGYNGCAVCHTTKD